MKTKMRKQSLPKRKKLPSELVPNRPPVGDRWELLDFENEYKDNWQWVALCVVKGYGKILLKLFIWRWAPDKGEWKVSWANMEVSRLNLWRVAQDAQELAGRYGIRLTW